MTQNKIQKLMDPHPVVFTLLFGYILAILLSLTTIWQLCILAGIFTGVVLAIKKQHLLKARLTFLIGLLSVVLAWMTILIVLMIIQPTFALIDLILAYIIGSKGMGIIGLILTLVIGSLVGGFGGLIGFALYKVKKPSDTAESPKSTN
jgi:hypothetical protein